MISCFSGVRERRELGELPESVCTWRPPVLSLKVDESVIHSRTIAYNNSTNDVRLRKFVIKKENHRLGEIGEMSLTIIHFLNA